ncbi:MULTISPECIES: glycosyltransferase [Streptomyces]|uniref:glycosyltransferase n=1 Tax=Streptomyces TaxID=1883 RepID=UPI002248F959|nr:glycosyltransferase [Streptomyces sp. JHD 1]MCX2970694.1 glycosyltransferase [Streptomyces sp. JHD 1]
MRIVLWHVHGSWTTSFVRGPHTYLLPVLPDRGEDGRGRARTWDWPANAVEMTPEELRETDVDLVLLQRPHEAELAERWLGRRPGRDVPVVYLEHSTPLGGVPDAVHPAAGMPGCTLVHVTHFNRLFWDAGTTPTTVIEHGVIDPGPRYTGAQARAAVAVNEPLRRGRVTGTDLLPHFADAVPLDVFGMGTAGLADHLGLPGERCRSRELQQDELHTAMAARRVYLHPFRWTSLGLSLLEAMYLGMPVVALDTTETAEAVPPDAGVVSNRLDVLREALRTFAADPEHARLTGERARAAVSARYGLHRFLDDWERLTKEVTR